MKNGATLLVTVTNDAWFAKSSELRAHFAAVVFRAVETRRTAIQAANGGVSGIVDPRGRVLKEVIGEEILLAVVERQRDQSRYTRWGNWPLCAVLGISGLAAAVWQIKRGWILAARR